MFKSTSFHKIFELSKESHATKCGKEPKRHDVNLVRLGVEKKRYKLTSIHTRKKRDIFSPFFMSSSFLHLYACVSDLHHGDRHKASFTTRGNILCVYLRVCLVSGPEFLSQTFFRTTRKRRQQAERIPLPFTKLFRNSVRQKHTVMSTENLALVRSRSTVIL